MHKESISNKILHIEKLFVSSILELFTFINENNLNQSKFYCLDLYIDNLAQREKNANQYRLKYKELLLNYLSACNLCNNIDQVINISKTRNYPISIQTINPPKDVENNHCNTWHSSYTLFTETSNFDNDINLKILVEVFLNNLQINDTIDRNSIYTALNEYADTIHNINLTYSDSKKIINTLVKIFREKKNSGLINHHGIKRYNELTINEDYYFWSKHFEKLYTYFYTELSNIYQRGGKYSLNETKKIKSIRKHRNIKKSITKNYTIH